MTFYQTLRFCLALGLPPLLAASLLAQSKATHALEPAPEHVEQPTTAMNQAAYLHYLLALRSATDGIPYTALHEAATSLRLQGKDNPAAGIAFDLIAAQRQDVHLHLCCFSAKLRIARYSPDGTRILTAHDDGSIQIWNAQTGLPVSHRMQNSGSILAVAWSADSKRIASSASDGKLQLWNAETAEPVKPPITFEKPLVRIALNPAGSLVLGSHDGVVALWNVESGAIVTPKPYHDDVNVVAFSNDGRLALIATDDDFADIVDPATTKRLHRLSLGNAAFSASFSNDSQFVLTGSEDHTARIWNTSSGTQSGASFEHKAAISNAEFSRDGTMVLTTSLDHTARVWNAQTGKPITPLLQHSAPVLGGSFSTDNTQVFTRAGDGSLHVWSVATGEPAAVPLSHVTNAAFSPRDSELMIAYEDSVEILDIAPSGAAPAWLADLADFDAGRSPYQKELKQDRARIEQLQRTMLSSTRRDRWTQFAQWYFALPQARTVSPWSTLPLQTYVDNLIHTGTAQSLAYAQSASAGHPAWLLRIAEARRQIGASRK